MLNLQRVFAKLFILLKTTSNLPDFNQILIGYRFPRTVAKLKFLYDTLTIICPILLLIRKAMIYKTFLKLLLNLESSNCFNSIVFELCRFRNFRI